MTHENWKNPSRITCNRCNGFVGPCEFWINDGMETVKDFPALPEDSPEFWDCPVEITSL